MSKIRRLPEMKPFEPGQEIENAEILAVLSAGPRAAEIIYLARALCCGAEIQLSHKAIQQRRRSASNLCRNCCRNGPNKKKPNKSEEPAFGGTPGWAPPPSALRKSGKVF